jgi:hypothetical protein
VSPHERIAAAPHEVKTDSPLIEAKRGQRHRAERLGRP